MIDSYKKERKATDLRNYLMAAIEGVINGRINVREANAIASLSSEVHKSLRLEKLDQILSSETVFIDAKGRTIDLLGEVK